ncbi:hypothetical protein A3B40_04985 [Candidatus Roizmanbacteria bacterium RIFCSPLOWO2_01_FULL_37_16]|uniref:HTH luxR-type domain-containing protein n=1 Tax=Candidatus Roizmanbacteria bacterium RIFCSPLOWO2_01_FULL_37_16 TaxID=1802058 RepID=A0A1F7IK24_9BACT|nr:MAG: hypothetical protein A2859_04350 [Candidatus Roizmanbacteria bacterium RIFCSPHIGHO2_01_FULL_37_16b]OGK32428.1 MAG: hypothetical protein A3F57_05000 [Candidatus Roizmanbacteria bacterium RIFCSPHIGHO2_12_FULL_36_11]OGK43711.1 MAG: hypothetical protein A3B40_04985 [Candidatus Roizmanbacteria bacterium RIFCSPLOWO2_01_FULL_37_16]
MQTLSDKEVLIRIKNGEIDHFTYLVKKYTNQILNFVSKKIKNRFDSEDIVQETFLNFYKAVHRFDEKKPILPYLFQITRNEMKMYWRSRKQMVRLDEKIIVEENQESETKVAIEKHLNQLPKEQKKALQLVGDGYSYQEIAKILGRPINTIRTIIRRARLKMIKFKIL